jgi:hypothetical protein
MLEKCRVSLRCRIEQSAKVDHFDLSFDIGIAVPAEVTESIRRIIKGGIFTPLAHCVREVREDVDVAGQLAFARGRPVLDITPPSRMRRRSVTLDVPIAATAMLAEIAEELVRIALADHPQEKTISLLAISVSHLHKQVEMQLDLPFGLTDEHRRPGAKRGIARWTADKAVDTILQRFGRLRIGGAPVRSGRIPRTCRKGIVGRPSWG